MKRLWLAIVLCGMAAFIVLSSGRPQAEQGDCCRQAFVDQAEISEMKTRIDDIDHWRETTVDVSSSLVSSKLAVLEFKVDRIESVMWALLMLMVSTVVVALLRLIIPGIKTLKAKSGD